MDTEKLSHPSYGMISFSRINGGRQKFYGSELIPENHIEMRVMGSEMETSLTGVRYYGKERLLSVRMTAVQFSELITSMNMGDGVPCTISYLGGTKVEPVPHVEGRPDHVLRKFKDRLNTMSENIRKHDKELERLLSKPKLSKTDKEDIRALTQKHSTEVESNMPFFLRCFQESMDEIVVDAKTTIDSALMHKITTVGLEELHKQNKLLSDYLSKV